MKMLKSILFVLLLLILCGAAFGGAAPGWPPPSYVIAHQWQNVKDYGAKGDGTTDDVAAFRAAIAAAGNGGIVYVPPGTYLFSDTLAISGDSIILEGAGVASVIKADSGHNENIIAITGKTGVVIRDLMIDGNNANNDSVRSAIIFVGCTDFMVSNVKIVDMYGQSIGIGGEGNPSSDGVVEHCKISGGSSNHIDVNSSQNIRILYNTITGAMAGEEGIFMGHGLTEDHLVMGNRVDSANFGVSLGNAMFVSDTSSLRRIRIIGNSFVSNQHSGVALWGASHCIIANNECIGNNTGGPGGSGIYLADGHPTDVTVPYDDTVGSTHNVIVGNRCYDTANVQMYGLQSLGKSDSNYVSGNNFEGNNSGTYSLVGTNFFSPYADTAAIHYGHLWVSPTWAPEIQTYNAGQNAPLIVKADSTQFMFVEQHGYLKLWIGDSAFSAGIPWEIAGPAANNLPYIRMQSDTTRFRGNVIIDSPLTIGNYTYPIADGAAGYVLETNGSGALSWQPNDTSGTPQIDTFLVVESTSTVGGWVHSGDKIFIDTTGGTEDSIGVDTDGDGVVDNYIYPSFLKRGGNITFVVTGDTLTISGPAASGTADSLGVDTDGDGAINNYLYSTVSGAFHIKKGANITLTVDTDTLTIAGVAGAGTADSIGVDTDGNGTVDAYMYSTSAGAAHLKKGTGMVLSVAGDTTTFTVDADIRNHTLDTAEVLDILRDSISGDATVGAGGALTIAANAVESTMIGADQVNDKDVNFGTGTDQVSATDLPDFGTMTTTDDNILVADGVDFESVAMSGDATMNNGVVDVTVDSGDIVNAGVAEADLSISNAPTDEYALTWEGSAGTGGQMTWEAQSGATGTADSVYINTGSQYGPFINDMYKIKEDTGISIQWDDSITYDVFNFKTTLGTDIEGSELTSGLHDSIVNGATAYAGRDTTLVLSEAHGGADKVYWDNDTLKTITSGNDTLRTYHDGTSWVFDGGEGLTIVDSLLIHQRLYTGDTTTGDVDVFHYFSTNGSYTTEYFKWDDGNSRFELSDDLHVGGNITVTGTVDGIDVSVFHSDYATDSTKLAGIESGATADQTVVDSAIIAADSWAAHKDKDGDTIDVSAYVTTETDPVWVSDSGDYAMKTWVETEIEDSLNEYSLTSAIVLAYLAKTDSGTWDEVTAKVVLNQVVIGNVSDSSEADSNVATRGYVTGQGYLTSESDPVYIADPASGITAADTVGWNKGKDSGLVAWNWGNHASQNYLDNDDANVDTAAWNAAIGGGFWAFRDSTTIVYVNDSTGDTILFLQDTTGFQGIRMGGSIIGVESLVVTGAITVPANSISDNELDEAANFNWTGTNVFEATFRVDDGVGDSPSILIQDGDNKWFSLKKYDAGHSVLYNNDGALRFQFSFDDDDYIYMDTFSANVPMISTGGACDLVINASSGEISFGDENLTTTGTLDAGATSVTGNITVTGTVDTVDVAALGATVPLITDDTTHFKEAYDSSQHDFLRTSEVGPFIDSTSTDTIEYAHKAVNADTAAYSADNFVDPYFSGDVTYTGSLIGWQRRGAFPSLDSLNIDLPNDPLNMIIHTWIVKDTGGPPLDSIYCCWGDSLAKCTVTTHPSVAWADNGIFGDYDSRDTNFDSTSPRGVIVITPYNLGADCENPCILATHGKDSADNFNWRSWGSDTTQNPIITPYELNLFCADTSNKDPNGNDYSPYFWSFFSDAGVFPGHGRDSLWVYMRAKGFDTSLVDTPIVEAIWLLATDGSRQTSGDDSGHLVWTDPTMIYCDTAGFWGDSTSYSCLSPFILQFVGGKYRMWLTHSVKDTANYMWIYETDGSPDAEYWDTLGKSYIVDNDTIRAAMSDTLLELWHPNALAWSPNVLVGLFSYGEWGGSGGQGELYVAESNDGGWTWRVRDSVFLPYDSSGDSSWFDNIIYRAAAWWNIYANGEVTMDVFFAGNHGTSSGNWDIGHAETYWTQAAGSSKDTVRHVAQLSTVGVEEYKADDSVIITGPLSKGANYTYLCKDSALEDNYSKVFEIKGWIPWPMTIDTVRLKVNASATDSVIIEAHVLYGPNLANSNENEARDLWWYTTTPDTLSLGDQILAFEVTGSPPNYDSTAIEGSWFKLKLQVKIENAGTNCYPKWVELIGREIR